MNAIERRNRRVRRFAILTQINEIEQANCQVCPNRLSTDLSCCKVCPVPGQLSALGEQLVSLSDRTNVEKIKEEPNVKYEVAPVYRFYRGKKRKKREVERKPLTYDEMLEGIATHGKLAAFARTLGIAENTVRNRSYALGLKGIRKAQAQEMMRKKEALA